MEGARPALRLAAPAKLNLSLRVVGRRGDGFHELESVMVLLGLADELVLAPGEGMHVDPPAHGVPSGPARNLAWMGLVLGTAGAAGGLSLVEALKTIETDGLLHPL